MESAQDRAITRYLLRCANWSASIASAATSSAHSPGALPQTKSFDTFDFAPSRR